MTGAVAVVDTSVLCEILAIPGKSQQPDETTQELREKVAARETLFLPLAVIFETGNHIGHLGDGRLRRRLAEDLVAVVTSGSFVSTPLPDVTAMRGWLAEFPGWVARASGLADLSLKHEWERLCRQNRGRRVYIWSKEPHLSAYDHPGL